MKYDLHIHTHYSKCSNLKPEQILKIAKLKGLNGIAITDHNTMKGAIEVAKLNKDPNFEVIIGEEIMTDKGEILAYYLQKEIKPGKFESVLSEIRKQKAIAAIAHPYAIGIIGRKGASEEVFNKVDAIETLNSRAFFDSENEKARISAKRRRIAQTAGSDAHFSFEIGKAYVEFEGTLREAIKQNKIRAFGKKGNALSSRTLTFVHKYLFRHF